MLAVACCSAAPVFVHGGPLTRSSLFFVVPYRMNKCYVHGDCGPSVLSCLPVTQDQRI